MHVVVNHLHLRDPMPPEIVEKAHDAVRGIVDAGGRAAHVAKVDDRHLVLIPVFDGPEDAVRVARDVGGPWMRENSGAATGSRHGTKRRRDHRLSGGLTRPA